MHIDQQLGEGLKQQNRGTQLAAVPDVPESRTRVVGGLPDRRVRRLAWRASRYLALCFAVVFSAACSAASPSTPAVAMEPSSVAVAPPTATNSAITTTATATTTPTATPTIAATATSFTAAATLPPTLTPTAEPSPTPTTPTIPEPSPTVEPTPTATTMPTVDPALASELQRILDGIIADGYIPGAVLAVSIPGHETWLGSTGFVDRERTQAMAPDTRYRIASISKIFTAVVVLQLAEEGRIDLDAPMSTWLPDLVPQSDQITVRQLLQHTSGVYDYLEDAGFREQAYQSPERGWAPRELVTYAARFPLAFQPGAAGAWDYSSTNYVLLGMLVEQVTGRTLAQEMRERIFEPLRLDATFFAPDEPVAGTQAHGHFKGRDLETVSMSFAYATANLVSTVDDVQRFIRALVDGELLQPATLEAMFAFVNGHGQYKMPALEYGLGLMRNQLPVGPAANGGARPPQASTVVGHTGGFAGFRSVVWSAPGSGITVALGLNQSDTDPNILATQVFDAVLRQLGQ